MQKVNSGWINDSRFKRMYVTGPDRRFYWYCILAPVIAVIPSLIIISL